jgi:hypothetical protein
MSQTTSRKPVGNRCRVGFWNVSNRNLKLNINGRMHRLPRGGTITLRLQRGFVWQVTGSTPHEERVPVGKSNMEIVIRR